MTPYIKIYHGQKGIMLLRLMDNRQDRLMKAYNAVKHIYTGTPHRIDSNINLEDK